MHVAPSNFTVAEYCEQMQAKSIVVDKNYQRSGKVWPLPAKSYLIDSILCGYPIPKIALHQKTDVKSRKIIKYIIDGQQRSNTILEFYSDELRLSGKGEYSGYKFSELDADVRQRFMEYQVGVDIFVSATEEQIRQLFRRVNSYTVPLNHQEKRHATYQGEFKWFILDLSNKYDEALKHMGTLNERQLSRMHDGELLSMLTEAMLEGIGTQSQPRLEKLYKSRDDVFLEAGEVQKRMDDAFSKLLGWRTIHGGPLFKPSNFFSLFLAITNVLIPCQALRGDYVPTHPGVINDALALANLGLVCDVLDGNRVEPKLARFLKASESGTNTKENRRTRFQVLSSAIENSHFP